MKRSFAFLVGALVVAPTLASAQGWADNFDGYTNGQQLHGVGGWTGWDNTPAAGALVSNAFANTAPNSVAITGGSDLVHEYAGVTAGTWRYRTKVYVPSTLVTGSTYFILMNRYTVGAAAPKAWSAEYEFNLATNQVDDDFALPSTTWGSAPSTPQTIVRNAWTDILVEFDPVANTAKNFYNGALLHGAGRLWYETGNANAVPELQAVDLYANNVGPVYYDNCSLQRVLQVTSHVITSGIPFGGNTASLTSSDDNKLFILCDESAPNGEVVMTSNSPFAITFLQLNSETASVRTDQTVFFAAKNQTTSVWASMGSKVATLLDSKHVATLANAGAFRATNGNIETRIQFVPFADLEAADGWDDSIDQAEVEVR